MYGLFVDGIKYEKTDLLYDIRGHERAEKGHEMAPEGKAQRWQKGAASEGREG